MTRIRTRKFYAVLTMVCAPMLMGLSGISAHSPERYFDGDALIIASAIKEGDVATVQTLAPKTALNTPGKEDMTLLFYALHEAMGEKPEQLAIMTALVKAGADPKFSVTDFGSVLGVCLRAEHSVYVKALLDGGVSPNAVIGSAPILFEAASEHTFETLKLLLRRGADIDKKDSLGNTVLIHALQAMQLDQVVYLLEQGANPNIVNINGVSFAGQLQFQMGRQQDGSPAQRKMIEIRDLITKRGVLWPPASRDEEIIRMKKRGQ